jgi:predicted Zn finger-like uncharacterized protein
MSLAPVEWLAAFQDNRIRSASKGRAMERMIRCPACKRSIRLSAEQLGKSIRCGHCGAVLRLRGETTRSTEARVKSVPAPPVRVQAPRTRWRTVIFAGGVVVGVILAVLFWVVPGGQRPVPPEPNSVETPAVPAPVPPPVKPPPVAAGRRRGLLVAVCDYLYASPVAFGGARRSDPNGAGAELQPDDATIVDCWHLFGDALGIPRDRALVLSDRVRGAGMPSKQRIEAAIADVVRASDSRDQVLIAFIGHVAVVDGQSYLMAIDSHPAQPSTLIDFRWIQAQFAQCGARQKIVLLDVCRFDPRRAAAWPIVDPMAPAFVSMLKQTSRGVTIWSGCGPGQYSLETTEEGRGWVVTGGLFWRELANGAVATIGKLGPDDPWPIEQLAASDDAIAVSQRVKAEALRVAGTAQTPVAVIGEGATAEKARPEVNKAVAPAGTGEISTAVLAQINRMPHAALVPCALAGLRLGTVALVGAKTAGESGTAADRSLELAADRIVQVLERTPSGLQSSWPEMDENRLKGQALSRQRTVAVAIATLEEVLTEMTRMEQKATGRSAYYELARAVLDGRIAALYEYDYLLAQVRKDALPERRPGQTGWRLVPRASMQSARESKGLAKQSAQAARQRLERIVETYAGTSWEVAARRELLAPLGLEWQPAAGHSGVRR